MIIFGLGNPGLEYCWTRHNAGFIFVNRLAKKYGVQFSRAQTHTSTRIRINSNTVRLVKPLLFMNCSGKVVEEVLSKDPDNFLVIVDDINLPLGKLRLREKGGDGGHLGLRSIIEALGRNDFPRLRIGIGYLNNYSFKEGLVDYVLTPFCKDEKRYLNRVINKGIEGIEILIKEGFMKAQHYINSI